MNTSQTISAVLLIYLLTTTFISIFAQTGGVAINKAGIPAVPSAILDISSTTQGILIPRMNNTERDAIPSPAKGLIIYNTDSGTFNIYKNNAWHELLSSYTGSISGTLSPGGGTAINNNGINADSSAILDIISNDRGILIPGTVTASIVNPAEGIIIFDTSSNNIKYYDGSKWQIVCENLLSAITGIGTNTATGVAINNSNSLPDPSAILDISSSTMGILIPRMTTSERNIILPKTGLTIYNSETANIEFHNGTAWYSLSTGVGTAGTITGNFSVCEGQSAITYYTDPILNATLYVWSYTGTGFTIVSGNGNNSISVNFLPGSTSGNLSVYGSNACGDGIISAYFPITVSPVTTAGISISASSNPICLNNSVTFIATPVNGGSSPTFQWKKNGIDIIGETNLTYTTTSLINYDVISCEMVSSDICVNNSPILSNSINISVINPPTSANAGNDQNIAGTSTILNANPAVSGNGIWSIISGNGGNISTPSDPTSSFTGISGNTYILQWTINNPPCAASADQVTISFTSCTIGASIGGGIVFYNGGPGNCYVASTIDQSQGASWGCYGTTIGGTSTAFGTGQANTSQIVSQCGQGTAAAICDNLVSGGYTDWFLPSKDEFTEMYNQKSIIGGFTTDWYWTSSEYNYDYAWKREFYYNDQYWDDKFKSASVRAIRKF